MNSKQSVRIGFRALFFAASLLGFWGCASTKPPKEFQLPPNLEASLAAGDIFLSLSHSPLSLLFASGGDASLLKREEGVLFSHAMVLLPPSEKDREWKLAGMGSGKIQKRSMRKSFPSSRFVAFYRLREPTDAGKQIACQAENFLRDPEVRNATFDYHLKDEPKRRNQFFCLGFVNEIYRSKGFPIPFSPPNPPRCGAMTEEASTLLETDMGSTPIAVDIQKNPHYQRVFFWRNPRFSPERYWLDIEVFQILDRFVAEGWHLKPKGSVLLLRAAHHLGMVPKKGVEIKRFKISFSRFYERVHFTWSRLRKQGRLEGLSEAEKKKLLERVCLKYRDKFFTKKEE